MSQKKLKRLRKEADVLDGQKSEVKVSGIREILRKNWKFLLILCLGVVAVYFNSLWGAFVSDDYATIPQNTEIMSIKAAWINTPNSFFVSLTKTLIALVFGIDSPVAFHVVSLILYLLVCIAVFVFLKLFFDDLTSKIALVLFAVFPIHVEAISWISGLPYLISSLLILWELIFLIFFLRRKNKKYLLWLLLFGLISVFTDRIRGFAFVLLAGLVLVVFKEELKIKFNLGKIFIIVITAFGILMMVAWPMVKDRIYSVNSGINASDSVFYNPFYQYPTAATKYLQLVVVPTDLTLYHTMYTVPVWLNWLILGIYLGSLGWFWFNDKRIFFALAFIFVAAAPSMAPVKVSWLVAERYMFLGSLGMALLIAIILEKCWKLKKIIAVGGLSVLTAFYAARIILRNIDWQTNHNLWVNTCQVSPNSHNAWNNIGDDYDKLGQYENAIKGFGQSFAIKPNYADAYHNQANIFYKIGRLDLARNGYETAVYYNPNLIQTYQTLVQLDVIENNRIELSKHLNILIKLNPTDLQIRYLAALAYQKVGMVDEAKKIADEIYKYYPNIKEIKDLYNSLHI